MPNEGYNESITDLDVIPEEKDLIIDGTPLSSFGVIVTREHGWDVPERDIDVYDVPGRNGALVIDNNKYKNITITYKCSILYDAKDRIRNLISFLYSDFGYRTIEDGWMPGYFRQGRIITPLSPELYAARAYDTANFELSFDCKPQRWLTGAQSMIPLPYVTQDYYYNEDWLKWNLSDGATIDTFTIKPTVNEGAYSPHANIAVHILRTDGVLQQIVVPDNQGFPPDLFEYPELPIDVSEAEKIYVRNLDTAENGMEIRVNGVCVDRPNYIARRRSSIRNDSDRIAKPVITFDAGGLISQKSNWCIRVWHEDGTETRFDILDTIGGEAGGGIIHLDSENYEFYRNYGVSNNELSWTGEALILKPGQNIIGVGWTASDEYDADLLFLRVQPNVWEV